MRTTLPKFLYHGTSSQHLEAILRNGIEPRAVRGAPSNWQELPSHPEMVYLTTTYPGYYAAANLEPTDSLLLVEVEVARLDSKLFYPDEDYLGHLLVQHGRAPDLGRAIELG